MHTIKPHLVMLTKDLSNYMVKFVLWVLCVCVCVWYLDVLGGFEAIQLIEQLQHCPLHLAVTTWAALQTGRADGVDLIHEDDGRSVFSSHDKQLTHHTSAWWKREREGSRLHNQFWKNEINLIRRRQSCSPSPMNFWTSSEPDTLMKVQSVWWATALASRVFPVPGGPYSSTPCTHSKQNRNQNHLHSNRWRQHVTRAVTII